MFSAKNIHDNDQQCAAMRDKFRAQANDETLPVGKRLDAGRVAAKYENELWKATNSDEWK